MTYIFFYSPTLVGGFYSLTDVGTAAKNRQVVCARPTALHCPSHTADDLASIPTLTLQKLLLLVALLLLGRAESPAHSRKHHPVATGAKVLTWSH